MKYYELFLKSYEKIIKDFENNEEGRKLQLEQLKAQIANTLKEIEIFTESNMPKILLFSGAKLYFYVQIIDLKNFLATYLPKKYFLYF